MVLTIVCRDTINCKVTIYLCNGGPGHHPPYSPDLAPSTCISVPNIKKQLAGKQYQTDAEVISATVDLIENQDESFYTMGIQALQH